MDFALTPDQEALRDLVREILHARCTRERLREVEQGPVGFDRDLWGELGRAHLLGVALPEDVGGTGAGLIELCLVLEEAGRHVAPIPIVASLAMGALPVDRFGSAEQRKELLPPVVAGEAVLTAALTEGLLDDPAAGGVAAVRDGSRWRLEGVLTSVPAAEAAARMLVPASADAEGVVVFLVDPRSSGVSVARQRTTGLEPHARLELDGAAAGEADVLGEPGAGGEIVRWMLDRSLAGLCAVQVGICERALRLTAEYTSGREQFGKPLATFQAVQQRLADCYIDVEAMRATTWRAVWMLSRELPATEEVAVAKFWASEAGHRVLAAAQHLHGGVGVDVDYPLHRYTLRGKQIEMTLGSATRHLARLGDRMADG